MSWIHLGRCLRSWPKSIKDSVCTNYFTLVHTTSVALFSLCVFFVSTSFKSTLIKCTGFFNLSPSLQVKISLKHYMSDIFGHQCGLNICPLRPDQDCKTLWDYLESLSLAPHILRLPRSPVQITYQQCSEMR